jgi:single-stranded-DNA-specific exonuclease
MVSQKTRKRWNVLPPAPPEHFEAFRDYPKLVAQLLYHRGVRTLQAAEGFFTPRLTAAPLDGLPGAGAGVTRLAKAIQNGERIAVYGDFDADGVTSAALLTQAIRGLGAQVVPYIPDRVAEGHGLNLKGLQFLRDQGISLVVTADCGVSNAQEVATASDWGMDVVIMDHHSPPARLPPATAVIDPKLPNADPSFAPLASVGVAFKLAEALYAHFGKAVDRSLLEFVALGTVADVAPLTGQNRALVREGLASINRTRHPGLQELMRVAGLQPGHVDTEAIGFALGPRLNAPGRIDHADASYLLLTARSADEARPCAERMDAANRERQRQTREIFERAQRMVGDGSSQPIIIVGDPSFEPGVMGLVASKLCDQFYRPTVVYQNVVEETRASCRSILEFNIIAALREHDGLFTRYGGHAQAAGFTLPTSRLPLFKERLLASAARLNSAALMPHITIDAQVSLERLNGEVIRALQALAPHGEGNPQPTFLAKGLEVSDARQMGDQGQHVRLKLRSGNVTWSAVAFNTPESVQPMPKKIDAVFSITVDRFDGREMLRLNIVDMRPTTT